MRKKIGLAIVTAAALTAWMVAEPRNRRVEAEAAETTAAVELEPVVAGTAATVVELPVQQP